MLWTRLRDNEGMEQFFGALSDLTRGCDFGDREESLDSDVFILNMKNAELKKQWCMETMSRAEALTFAAVRERGELMYNKVSGRLPRFGKN